MRQLLLILVAVLSLAGCATVQIPDYIPADHPYSRKVYSDFDQVTGVVKDVLARQGWRIHNEVDPSVYERDGRYESKGARGLLIFTEVKQSAFVLFSTYTHLNVFLYSPGSDYTEVEIRFGAVTPMVKQFKSTHNDRLANRLLDAIEQNSVHP